MNRHLLELTDGEYSELCRAIAVAERVATANALRAEGTQDTLWAETLEDLSSLHAKVRQSRHRAESVD